MRTIEEHLVGICRAFPGVMLVRVNGIVNVVDYTDEFEKLLKMGIENHIALWGMFYIAYDVNTKKYRMEVAQ